MIPPPSAVELARQNHALETEAPRLNHTREIVYRHLRRGMKAEPGEKTLCDSCHGKILNDDRVHAELLERGEGRDQMGELGVR